MRDLVVPPANCLSISRPTLNEGFSTGTHHEALVIVTYPTAVPTPVGTISLVYALRNTISAKLGFLYNRMVCLTPRNTCGLAASIGNNRLIGSIRLICLSYLFGLV